MFKIRVKEEFQICEMSEFGFDNVNTLYSRMENRIHAREKINSIFLSKQAKDLLDMYKCICKQYKQYISNV